MPRYAQLELYSQEVKVVLELLVHGDVGAISLRILVVIGMESFLVRILHDGWNLYRRLIETIVLITLLVCELLNLPFVQLGGIVDNLVVNWNRSCGIWVFVRNHEEVKDLITIVFDNRSVDHRAWLRIHLVTVFFLEDSCGRVEVK